MIILLTLILKIGGLLALAASPRVLVALVESVTGAPAGVQVMDYVERGQVIRLAPGDSVVLGYFKSCVQETITGGVVTVGADQSTVQGGRVERANVMCAGNDKMQSAGEVNTSGGMIFRGEPHSAPQRTKIFEMGLHQPFATGEMGFGGQFARQQS
jgi:hypothetical protein